LEVDDGASVHTRADNECEGFASIVGQVCVWMSRPAYPGDIYTSWTKEQKAVLSIKWPGRGAAWDHDLQRHEPIIVHMSVNRCEMAEEPRLLRHGSAAG